MCTHSVESVESLFYLFLCCVVASSLPLECARVCVFALYDLFVPIFLRALAVCGTCMGADG